QLFSVVLAVAKGEEEGYLYGKPLGEQFLESRPVESIRVRKSLKPRVYPAPLSQNCGNQDAASHAAAVAEYHAARPPPRRIHNHKELIVDSSFFEPSQEAIDELKRVLLDQE
ncbi:hypothetical protein KR018_004046, partial [Drosophila ironensis]